MSQEEKGPIDARRVYPFRTKLGEEQKDRMAEDLLGMFGVKKALEEVGQNVWREGQIIAYGRLIKLQSRPIEVLQRKRNMYPQDKDSRTLELLPPYPSVTIDLTVGIRFLESRTPALIIADYGHQRLLGSEGKEITGDRMMEILKKEGWQKAMDYVFDGGEEKGKVKVFVHSRTKEVNVLSRVEAVEEFNKKLKELGTEREESDSLPQQVRNSWKSVIDELPESLRQKNYLTRGELQTWEKKVRGRNFLGMSIPFSKSK